MAAHKDDKHSCDQEDKHSSEQEDKHSCNQEDKHSCEQEDKHSSEQKEKMLEDSAANKAFLLSTSPPKFISLEHLMHAANGVTNMVLAHEIAVDKDFKLEKYHLPPDCFESQIEDFMHQAFWDVLQEQIYNNPPEYNQAIKLLQEIKQGLLSLLLPQHTKIHGQICEALDIDLIHQQASHGVLDFKHYSDFIISIMAKMCAPVRDEQIKQLSGVTNIISLYRDIFKLLDLMKLDMANFTIMQFRPHIQQHIIQYERVKFQEFLDSQEDGLKYTEEWLLRNAKIQALYTEPLKTNNNVSPSTILNKSYLELLQWKDDDYIFPETLLMDQGRFLDLRDKVDLLILISAILLVTYNTVGTAIYGIQDFKQKLKNVITVLLNGVANKDYPSLMENISQQVVIEVNTCLQQHGFQQLCEDKKGILKGQIHQVIAIEHPVRKLIYTRVMDFIEHVTSSTTASPVKVPAGLSTMEEELATISGRFLRLISHNRAVFGSYYSNLIARICQDMTTISCN